MFKIYSNTRDYVNDKIVRPVLMRAGGMKYIGNHAADVAADRLDGALTIADKYIDRYLPDEEPTDTVDGTKTEGKRIFYQSHTLQKFSVNNGDFFFIHFCF